MSEWITDRKPTAEDANEDGCVWVTVQGYTVHCPYDTIERGVAWQPIAPPPPPPPPYLSEVTS